MNRRTAVLGAIATAVVLLLADPAGAHVEVGPGSAVAGSRTTLTFSFHHGKDGSATTGLEVRLPEGAELVEVPPVDGWTSSVSGDVVTWAGGRVPDGTEAAFPVVVELPPAAGVALFPTIQTTEAGELAWISPDEGEAEGEYPAPRVQLTAAPGAPSTSTTDAVEGPGTTLDLPRTVGEAEQRDDGTDETGATWLIGSGLAAVAVVVGGGLFLQRRAR